MDEIEFRVQPIPVVDDHEIRILVNGVDIIPNEMFGLDPVQGLQVESLLGQIALSEGGELWFARGLYETDEGAYVQVSRAEETVTWKQQEAEEPSFVFNAKQYDEAVSRLRTDFSWETPKRTAERLIRNLDYSGLSKYGAAFLWASARANRVEVAVCFTLDEGEEGKYQFVCYVPWDQKNPTEAFRNMEKLLQKSPQWWPDVKYDCQIPYKLHLRPVVAGPGWHPGS